MKQLQHFINMFTKISTGTLIVCAFMLTISEVRVWTTAVLWHILIVGAISSVITMIVLPDREFSRREGLIRFIIHYVLISAEVMFFGWQFGWYVPNVPSCAAMLLCIFVVYLFTYVSTWISSKRTADEMNHALEKRRGKK